ncbi:hypothetical protein [Nitrosospira sp. Is2]|jgi:hypothetical protein|uniref:hypothetical protein n=1 Tax=Nitrosospira sp. Is2 TaxID=3080532 RepID=UPI0029550483|nr:hypothetical protein [Nitrosospira sp. Is2]WON74208.1 hypothetical protein R5L00_01580 [Nitrosospira sp. Is2]
MNKGLDASLPNFVIVKDLITVEPILRPSWLIRRRIDGNSLTAGYVWVCTMAQTEDPDVCTVKGYLARDDYPMDPSERRALYEIGRELNFLKCEYERVDESGKLKAIREIRRKS